MRGHAAKGALHWWRLHEGIRTSAGCVAPSQALAKMSVQAWPAPPSFSQREPPAPVEGEFSMFGVTRSTEPPVAPPLEEQVYSTTADRCEELRKLNRSMLQSFLQLLQLMHSSPSQCCDKGAHSSPE